MAEWWQRYRGVLGSWLLGVVLGAGLTLLFMRPQPPPVRVLQPTAVPTPAEAVVHVGGAVNTPGVYRLSVAARVSDALEAAGGSTAEGDPNSLNLAARVRDGQRIEVPERGRPVGMSSGEGGTGARVQTTVHVNLNRADASQLDTLPGVGEVTARRILEYRDKVGRFERVEQLLDARLVNRGVFEQIKDLVSVE